MGFKNVQWFQIQEQCPLYFGLLFQAGRGREGSIEWQSTQQTPECHTGRGNTVGGREREEWRKVSEVREREDGV